MAGPPSCPTKLADFVVGKEEALSVYDSTSIRIEGGPRSNNRKLGAVCTVSFFCPVNLPLIQDRCRCKVFTHRAVTCRYVAI
uniref:Uncharacterized protein n=1 Tax=Anguilla anguilla TaxID=7936 RepID=A0A0E9VSU2_ANGAN